MSASAYLPAGRSGPWLTDGSGPLRRLQLTGAVPKIQGKLDACREEYKNMIAQQSKNSLRHKQGAWSLELGADDSDAWRSVENSRKWSHGNPFRRDLFAERLSANDKKMVRTPFFSFASYTKLDKTIGYSGRT